MTKSRTLILVIVAVFMLSFLAGCNASANESVNTAQSGADKLPPAGDIGTSPPVDQIVQGELRNMTVDDVRLLAENAGPDLTMEDLREFAVDDFGDGLYGYRVILGVDPYNLLVASDDMQTVLYTSFYNPLHGGIHGDNTSVSLDIRYYDIGKFITDGTQELVRQLPGSVEINDINIVGTWKSEIGSVTYFYEDSTGTTEGDDGIYGFSWRVISLTDAAADSLRGYRVREYYRILSDTPEGIHWGGNIDAPMTDGWSAEGYILVLTFDDIEIPFDYAFSMDGRDKLLLNTGALGEILSPRPNIEIRFQWVALTRES
jgi:hypothetical protein